MVRQREVSREHISVGLIGCGHAAEMHLAANNPPVWLLELAGYSQRYGWDSHEVVRWLAAKGYECLVYDADAQSFTPVAHPAEAARTNCLAVASAKRSEVIARTGGRLATG